MSLLCVKAVTFIKIIIIIILLPLRYLNTYIHGNLCMWKFSKALDFQSQLYAELISNIYDGRGFFARFHLGKFLLTTIYFVPVRYGCDFVCPFCYLNGILIKHLRELNAPKTMYDCQRSDTKRDNQAHTNTRNLLKL